MIAVGICFIYVVRTVQEIVVSEREACEEGVHRKDWGLQQCTPVTMCMSVNGIFTHPPFCIICCQAYLTIYHHTNQPPLGVTLHSTMEKFERIQYQAALAISGAWHGSTRSKLYEELGWETLSDRRMCRRILQIHKIFNNKTPSYLKNKLPPNFRPLYSGNIRKTFHEITCKSNRYKNSFFTDAIASWNIFIKHFDGVPSFNVLNDHTNR